MTCRTQGKGFQITGLREANRRRIDEMCSKPPRLSRKSLLCRSLLLHRSIRNSLENCKNLKVTVIRTNLNRVDSSAPATFDRWERALLLALMLFLASMGLFLLKAPDLGLHLVVGGYTLHHGLPETNVFSPVNSDHPLVQHEWAFQVLTYAISSLVGMDGLSVVRLVIVLMLGYVTNRVLLPGRGYVGAVACLALGLFVAHPRFVWRPELFSMLFLAVELRLLIEFVEDRRDRLNFLPVVFVVWANFHGYFLVGLIVVGCFVAGELGDAFFHGRSRDRATRLFGIGLLCIVATFLNPYHIEGALYPFRLLINLFTVDSQFTTTINELLPPQTFGSLWAVKAWYPLLVVFGGTCLAMGRKVRFSYLLTALALWVMARSTFRNIGIYGLTLGVLAAVQWQTRPSWNASWQWPRVFAHWKTHWNTQWNAIAVIVILVGMSGFIATNGLYRTELVRRDFGIGVSPRLASPARSFIAEYIPDDAQVFNTFDLGSRYLWWFYPERLPFIDGNGDGYSPDFYREYIQIVSGKQPFGPYARRYGIEWLYLDLKSKLVRNLYLNSGWYPVFLDADGIIFVNQSEKFSEIRQKVDLRKDLARGIIPNWIPTPLPTPMRQTLPFRGRMLASFLLSVREKRAASVVLAHLKQF